MAAPLTIAHLTDVHLGPIVGFSPRHWSLKRATGFVNWRRNRRDVYLRATLDALVADLKQQQPDHIAVTGDLVNIGLPGEIEAAHDWLTTLGPPEMVTVIPGNHDIYTPMRRDIGVARWAAYMQSNSAGQAFTITSDAGFPFVRMLGGVAVIALNSALPRPPLIASGELGVVQRERLAALLDDLGQQGHFRLVLIHHPPLPGQAKQHRDLTDAADLQAIFERCGAELVLHGHNHRNMLAWCDGPRAAVPVVGVPSASLGSLHGTEPLARYNLYRIHGRQIEMIGRGLAQPSGPIVELERRMLAPQTAQPQA